MKIKIMTGPFSKTDIETIIDKDLSEMFNPKIKISNEMKTQIREMSLSLSDSFLKITEQYITDELHPDYVDKVCNSIDDFINEFSNLTNKLSDKFIFSSVGIIWTGIFNKFWENLNNNSDSMFFQYGADKLTKILMKNLKITPHNKGSYAPSVSVHAKKCCDTLTMKQKTETE